MEKTKILITSFLAIFLGIGSIFAANTLPTNGSVGIGTLNPYADLHVLGQDSALGRNIYVQGDGEYQDLLLHVSSNVAGGPSSGNHVANTKFIVRGNGAIGMGTYTPAARLDVKGDTFVKRIKLDSDQSGIGPTSAGMMRWSGTDFEGFNGTEWVSLTAETTTTTIVINETVVINNTVSDTPSGAVMPFNLASCPDGWSEYTPAYGRFIRGVDKSGTNIDPDGQRSLGDTQGDLFKSHDHQIRGTLSGHGGGQVSFSYFGHSPSVATTFLESENAGGAETRPVNVALLYCEKD